MNIANESQKEPFSPKGFESTIPNGNYLVHFA